MTRDLTPTEDLILRINAVSQAWGFDGITIQAINQAFEILEPLIPAPTPAQEVQE